MTENKIPGTWKLFFANKKNRNILFLTLVCLVLVLYSLAVFLNCVEKRNGIVPADPVLELFSPFDLTWLTFALIYLSLSAAIYLLLRNPYQLLLTLQTYIIMVIFRIGAMYIVAFNPPATTIPLTDPITEIFGTGQLLTKDLFFSGHTATLFILYLTADSKLLKYIFLFCTIAVAFSVLLQHVHYTVDVLAAPVFAYCSYIIARKLKEQLSSVSI